LTVAAAQRQPAGATRYALAVDKGPTSLDEALRARIEANLSGFRRLPVSRDDLRPAAVAVTLIADDEGEPCFVLTLRAATMKNHASQFALPGGRLNPGETAEQAALRELSEEVGLELPPISVLGILDDYPTRSGFVITPVVVWAGADIELKPDPREVAEVYRVRLEELGRPGVPNLHKIPESPRPVISIPLVGTHVHAPTAAILYQLHEVAIEGRETRVVDFEQPVFAWR
jgi:8-oxo-dGTP pyrophosphatase MutT (NUDIX family)